MPRRPSGHAVAAVAASLLASLGVAAPLSSQEDVQASFGEVVDVRVINLEVVVTERDGERVSGLGPGDFRLLVDGEEVAVSHFAEVRDGRAAGEVSGAAATAPAGLAAGGPVPNHYLLFLDDEYGLDHQRDWVLDRVLGQLRQLRPDDRMAVVTYDGERVRVLADWTAPGPELEQALRQARELDGWGILRLLEGRGFAFGDPTFDTPSALLGSPDGVPTLFQENLRWQTRERLGIQMLAVASALTHFHDTPGRKVLMLLAGNWPTIGALSPYGGALDGPALLTSFDLFRPMVETANLLGWTVYPVGVSPRVDPPGTSGIDAGAVGGGRSRLLANASAGSQAQRVNAANSDGSLQRVLGDSTLRYLARETGGRAVLYSERASALEEVVEDTRSYYWIGFQPSFVGDDQRHRVEIDVRRPGLSARTREGFIDLAADTARLLAFQGERIRTRTNPSP